ncbi:MAG: hypothetical protein OEN02_15535 [Gammaproteobacteria bacterium]|nr:hypothetical protein [Gammaproteobacteria bacterium]
MQPNLEPDANTAHRLFGFGTQIRKSPFFDATVRWCATGFSVYNHMYIPRDFGDPVFQCGYGAWSSRIRS